MKQNKKYNLADLELLLKQKFGDIVLRYKEESSVPNSNMTFVSSEKKDINNILWKLIGKISINDGKISCAVSLVYDTLTGPNKSEYPILFLEQKNGTWRIV